MQGRHSGPGALVPPRHLPPTLRGGAATPVLPLLRPGGAGQGLPLSQGMRQAAALQSKAAPIHPSGREWRSGPAAPHCYCAAGGLLA
jgi:hypothetical protein